MPVRLPLLAAFVLVSATIAAGGATLYRAQVDDIRSAAFAELSRVVDLEAYRIAAWRDERCSDARYFGRSPEVVSLLSGTPEAAELRRLEDLLAPLLRTHDYRTIAVLDERGRLVARVGAPDHELGASTLALVEQSRTQGRPMMGDVEPGAHGPRLDVVVDIRSEGAARAVGSLVFRVDPSRLLLRKLGPDGGRSDTALVTRGGAALVRVGGEGALAESLAARILAGADPAQVEVVEPEGQAVLAAYRAIDGSPWLVVTTLDRALAFADVPKRAALFGLLMILGIASTGGLLGERWLEAKREAREGQLVLSRVVEQSANLVLVTDTEGRIEWVNPRFEQVTGYALDDVRGENPRILQSGRTPRAVYAAMWRTVMAGETWRGELENRTKAGRVYTASAQISPIKDEDGRITHFIGVQEDITERRLLEAQIQQARKLESLGMLAGGVAHDFNNILTSILSLAQFVIDDLPATSQSRADVEEIKSAGLRAAGLTRQLLAFSRRQVIEPQRVDLNQLVVELSKLLRRLLNESIELSITPAPAPLPVLADPGQVERVLVNLVVNARDAMPSGGTLRIQVGSEDEPAPGGPARWAWVRVVDSGVGMSEETQAHLFEPFFTTKGKGRGTGLGLASSFGIISQSGGHIRVSSALGCGSTFEVRLPVLEGAADLASEPSPVCASTRTGKVLLAEDDPGLRDIVTRALEGVGLTVCSATDGEDALRKGRELGLADFSLIVTDVVMPKLGGRALVDQIRGEHPHIKVLFMSGWVEGELARPEELDSEDTAFLQKPFTPEVLASRVIGLLHPATRDLIVTRDPAEVGAERELTGDDRPARL